MEFLILGLDFDEEEFGILVLVIDVELSVDVLKLVIDDIVDRIFGC